MSHPFSQTAQELKRLTKRLNEYSQQALFAPSAEARQKAAAVAIESKKALDELWVNTAHQAHTVSEFLKVRAGLDGGTAVEQFIQRIEELDLSLRKAIYPEMSAAADSLRDAIAGSPCNGYTFKPRFY